MKRIKSRRKRKRIAKEKNDRKPKLIIHRCNGCPHCDRYARMGFRPKGHVMPISQKQLDKLNKNIK